MMTLGLDTSEPIGGVALYDGGAIAEERMMREPLRHAESLFPLIEQILNECKRERGQVDLVSINRGPGSFTGLRIGIAAAKGFSQASGVRLTGVDGTVAYRVRLGEESARVCVLIASRRDLLYARWFSGARPEEEIRVLRERAVLDRLKRERGEVTLVGSGARSVYEKIGDHPTIRLAPELDCPSPLWIARLGAHRGAANELCDVEPLYVEPVLA
jgi:tRNA threonylcarbamoyladenosine biosynthesis protein TsaB